MSHLAILILLIRLLSGGFYYTSTKVLSQAKVELPDDRGLGAFKKPFFVSLILFFSMSLALVAYFALKHNRPGVTKPTLRMTAMIVIPGVLEYVGQVLQLMGQASLPASLATIMKGSRVIWSAMLLIILMKRKLYAFHWAAVGLCVVGLVIASLSSLLNNRDMQWSALIGIGLTLVSELIRSLRGVLEEKMLKKLKYDSLFVVGMEGLCGFLFSLPLIFIVNEIPGKDNGYIENLYDTMYMFAHSLLVILLTCFIPFWVNGMFISGALITKMMSAVHNSLAGLMQGAVVWAFELILFYSIPGGYGEGWKTYSFLQLIGFVIIVFACLMYDADIRIPQLFYYPPNKNAASGIGNDSEDSREQIAKAVDEEKVVVSDVELKYLDAQQGKI